MVRTYKKSHFITAQILCQLHYIACKYLHIHCIGERNYETIHSRPVLNFFPPPSLLSLTVAIIGLPNFSLAVRNTCTTCSGAKESNISTLNSIRSALSRCPGPRAETSESVS